MNQNMRNVIVVGGGTAGSVRWRWVLWVSGLSMVALVTSSMLGLAPWVDRPYNEIYKTEMGPQGVVSVLLFVLMFGAAAASLWSLKYHTTVTAPLPVRSAKLSTVGRS